MTIMINEKISSDEWTEIASAPIANILLSGPVGGWKVYVASGMPFGPEVGMPVNATDGAWGSSVLGENENVYVRATSMYSGPAIEISGMMN